MGWQVEEWAAVSRGNFLLRTESGDTAAGEFVRWQDICYDPERTRCVGRDWRPSLGNACVP